jgi:hypothetical protein
MAFLLPIHFVGSIYLQSNGPDGIGGILGFLLNSYTRPDDNLPFSANVFFEVDDFAFMKEAGKIGT